MTVLILAHDSDTVAEVVQGELEARGVTVMKVNPSGFPARISIGAFLDGTSPWSGLLTDHGGPSVELRDITAVWQRRPSQFVMDERMSPAERAFAYGEARRGFGGVLAGLSGCLWVNDPMAAARAEYKPIQLAIATEVGLRVPRTLITSEPHTAYDWAEDLTRPVVYKPMSGVYHADEGERRVMFTSLVDDLDDLLDPAFARTAQMLQERIPKAFEARVCIFGTQIFAVRIDAASEQARKDWRSDYDALTYSVIELPEELTRSLRELLMKLGLVAGMVDLICTPSGCWVFLEVNQGGEFGWLAEATGLPMYAAMADLLEKGT
ncbi:ATP-grasp ribosomal peptide maturase [Actinomadura litoris]|uniref:ATP-grasp ribosomal peptide maturase n=1 Tax=Actinomadura litoris TaxID=2678616 RepID=UPI001FA74B79|nr:ATP-grasp ribosomal peptide maturase [Actinomadura litoris]